MASFFVVPREGKKPRGWSSVVPLEKIVLLLAMFSTSGGMLRLMTTKALGVVLMD